MTFRPRRPRGGPLDGDLTPLAWLGRPHCDRCFVALSARRVLEGLRRREPLVYPFTMAHGTRRELPVRWLCVDCECPPSEEIG